MRRRGRNSAGREAAREVLPNRWSHGFKRKHDGLIREEIADGQALRWKRHVSVWVRIKNRGARPVCSIALLFAAFDLVSERSLSIHCNRDLPAFLGDAIGPGQLDFALVCSRAAGENQAIHVGVAGIFRRRGFSQNDRGERLRLFGGSKIPLIGAGGFSRKALRMRLA